MIAHALLAIVCIASALSCDSDLSPALFALLPYHGFQAHPVWDSKLLVPLAEGISALCSRGWQTDLEHSLPLFEECQYYFPS